MISTIVVDGTVSGKHLLLRHLAGKKNIGAVQLYLASSKAVADASVLRLVTDIGEALALPSLDRVVGGFVDGLHGIGEGSTGGHFKKDAVLCRLYDDRLNAKCFDRRLDGHHDTISKTVGRWPVELRNRIVDQQQQDHALMSHDRAGKWQSGVLDRLRALDNNTETVVRKDSSVDVDELDGSLSVLMSANYPIRNLKTLRNNCSGVVGAWTPFINGRKFTMFRGVDMYEHGCVGVMTKPGNDGVDIASLRENVSYPSLKQIGSALKIDKIQGNIIMALENGTLPSRYLVDVMKHLDAAQLDIYVQISESSSEIIGQNSTSKIFSKVISGDPANGFIALDTSVDLSQAIGKTITFFTNDPAAIDIRIEGGQQQQDQMFFINMPPQTGSSNVTIKSKSPGVITENGIVKKFETHTVPLAWTFA